MKTFASRIFKIGINPCVNIPKKISTSFNKKGYIPVTAKINNKKFKATLIPVGGKHRLYLNMYMRKAIRKDTGDIIHISLQKDIQSRIIKTPLKLMESLRENHLLDIYKKLAPSKRKEVLKYFNSLKSPEAKERFIKRIILLIRKPSKSKAF